MGEAITVSKDFLRAELNGMELRLIDKLATKAEVDDLRKDHLSLRSEVDGLKRWRSYLAGVATTAALLAGSAVAIVLHPWH